MTDPRNGETHDGTGGPPAPIPKTCPDPSVLAFFRVGTRRCRMAAAVIAVVVGLTAQTASGAYAEARQAVLYLDAPAVSAERATRAGQVARAYSEAVDTASLKALAWLGVPARPAGVGAPQQERLAAAFASITAPDSGDATRYAAGYATGGVTPEAALRAGEVMLAQIGGDSGPEGAADDADAQMAAAGAVRPELGDGTRAPSARPDAKRVAPPKAFATQPDPGAEYASTPAPPSPSAKPSAQPTGATGIVVPAPSGTGRGGTRSSELAEAPSEGGVVSEGGSSAVGESYGLTGPVSDTGPMTAGDSHPSGDEQSPPASEPSITAGGPEGHLAQSEPSSPPGAGAAQAAPRVTRVARQATLPVQTTGADTGPTGESGAEIAFVPATSSELSPEPPATAGENPPPAAPASPSRENGDPEQGEEEKEEFAFVPARPADSGGTSGRHPRGSGSKPGAADGDAALGPEQTIVVTGDPAQGTTETSLAEEPSPAQPTTMEDDTDRPVLAQPTAQPVRTDQAARDEEEVLGPVGAQDGPYTTTGANGTRPPAATPSEERPSPEEQTSPEQESTPTTPTAQGADVTASAVAPGEDPQASATTEGDPVTDDADHPENDRAEAPPEPQQPDEGNPEDGPEHKGEHDRPKPRHERTMNRIERTEETEPGGKAAQRTAQDAVDRRLGGGKEPKAFVSGSPTDSRAPQQDGRQARLSYDSWVGADGTGPPTGPTSERRRQTPRVEVEHGAAADRAGADRALQPRAEQVTSEDHGQRVGWRSPHSPPVGRSRPAGAQAQGAGGSGWNETAGASGTAPGRALAAVPATPASPAADPAEVAPARDRSARAGSRVGSRTPHSAAPPPFGSAGTPGRPPAEDRGGRRAGGPPDQIRRPNA